MPLERAPLTDAEIATLRRWVDQGARLTPIVAARAAAVGGTARARPRRRSRRPCGRGGAVPRIDSSPRYLSKARVPQPALVTDAAVCATRACLDIWGLLPSRGTSCRRFSRISAPGKRDRLVTALLADNTKYAEHWMSFWNDLLRNEDGYSYFSDAEGGARQSITPYLLPALTNNTPYNEIVARLINPIAAGATRPGSSSASTGAARRAPRSQAVDAGGAEHGAGRSSASTSSATPATTASSASGS